MKQKNFLKMFNMFLSILFILSVLFYPTFSYAQNNTTMINTLESVSEENDSSDDAYVVLDAKTGEVVDEITNEELKMKSRSITTNHTEPYKVPLRSQSNISTREVIGADERTVVSHPYNEVAYFEFVLKGKPDMGTAVMVYKNLALTAAHCVVDDKEVISGGQVFPERMGGVSPYGSAGVSQMVVDKSFYEKEDPEADWCILILDRNIGEDSGWQGIAYSEDYSYFEDGELVNVTGYPSEKDYGTVQYTATGPVLKATQNYLRYDVDETKGQSGAPVYDKKGYVIGVNKGGYKEWGVVKSNQGTNINKERYELILSYMD